MKTTISKHRRKAFKVIAQRMVVQVLNNNSPLLDAEEEGLTDDELTILENEMKNIIERLRRVAVKNGGEFNQYGP